MTAEAAAAAVAAAGGGASWQAAWLCTEMRPSQTSICGKICGWTSGIARRGPAPPSNFQCQLSPAGPLLNPVYTLQLTH